MLSCPCLEQRSDADEPSLYAKRRFACLYYVYPFVFFVFCLTTETPSSASKSEQFSMNKSISWKASIMKRVASLKKRTTQVPLADLCLALVYALAKLPYLVDVQALG